MSDQDPPAQLEPPPPPSSDFQTAFALEPDGVIGDETWQALCPYTDNLCEPDGGDLDPPDVPAGITIDGQQQDILHSCTHDPFQSVDGVEDAQVAAELYLVDDPATGTRRVVEIRIEGANRLSVVASLSEASVGGVPLNRWCDASGRHACAELSYSFEEVPPSVQFRNAGTYEQITDAEISRSAGTEEITAGFEYSGRPWTPALGIGQYPGGGHECVRGQVSD